MARGTTKPDCKKHVVVSVQVRKSGDILPFGVQALAAEDVLEWLQPSGRRPEGCCCSTELSGGRGRELGVAGYYTRPIMHAPHTLRLTLANIQRKTFFRHESFDHAWQKAVRRCSTLASMYSSHAMQQEQSMEQSSSDGKGPRLLLTAYAPRCSGSTLGTLEPVSYTHLTLPTIYSV